LITDCEYIFNMLIKFKVVRESDSKQLSRYNLFNMPVIIEGSE